MGTNNIIVGAVALAVGVLLGLLLAPGGANVEEIETAIDERVATLETRLDETTSTLGAQMDETMTGLKAQIDETAASVGQMGDRVESAAREALGSQASMLEGLRGEVTDGLASVDAAIASQTDSLQERLSALGEGAALPEATDEEAAAADTGSEADEGETAAAETDASDFEGIGVGQTASFGDGRLRAFVSRVDADAQLARLSVNGANMALEAGQTVNVTTEDGTYCRLSLERIQTGRVAVNAACGDDLPAPEGARPGNIALLAEGAVRVFVSGVNDDSSAARLAVNGIDTQAVEVGGSLDVAVDDGTCTVSLDEIDRGHAVLSADCG